MSATCGLSAFSIAIIAGLAVDNPFEDIISRALVGMLAGHVVGFIVGTICEKTITDAISKYKSTRPMPAGGQGSRTGDDTRGTPGSGA